MKLHELRQLSVVFLMASVFLLMAGLHNIDNAWNMKYAESLTGLAFYESSLLISEIRANNVYMIGVLMVFLSYVLFAVGLKMLSKRDST